MNAFKCDTNGFLRAQTWHDPSDVEEALDQSLRALQLDYGKSNPFCDGRKLMTANQYTECISGPLLNAL